jgi:hypothetical protein
MQWVGASSPGEYTIIFFSNDGYDEYARVNVAILGYEECGLTSICPNNCSIELGQGICDESLNCSCTEGFFWPDCSRGTFILYI